MNFSLFKEQSLRLLNLLDTIDEGEKGEMSQDGEGRLVVFGNPRMDPFFMSFELLLASYLRQKGFRTRILVDDGCLLHHDNDKSESLLNIGPDWLSRQRRRLDFFRRRRRMYKAGMMGRSGVEVVEYSSARPQFTDKDAEEGRRMAKASDLTPQMLSSHRRYFGGRSYSSENTVHRKFAEINYYNEVVSRQVAQYLANLRPDLYMCLDGIYITNGTVKDFLRRQGIPSLIYQPDGFSDRYFFMGSEPMVVNHGGKHFYHFLQEHCDSQYIDKARDFLSQRTKKSGNSGDAESAIFLELRRKKENYKKTIAIFPNLTWDGAITSRDVIFDGILDWLIKTAKFCKDKGYLLVFREHPQAEDRYNTFESSIQLFKEEVKEKDLLENIFFVDGVTRLSSYDLIRYVDVSSVYNGTLIPEISFMQHPLVLGGRSLYSGHNLAYEPKSQVEYFDLLEQVSLQSPKFQEDKSDFYENCLKCSAYRFFFNSYFCPIMPRLEDFNSGDSDRYWKSWDLSKSAYQNPESGEWKRIFDRILFALRNVEESSP